eukprot:12169597-Prorocentrum_lima.AAC.1
MTSSLVGSEMCIRDSTTHSHPAPSHTHPSFARGAPRRPPPDVTISQSCICLLYTSDAADDM